MFIGWFECVDRIHKTE